MMEALHSVVLPSGRTLSWEDAGPRDGVPVLFCHGTPGSRLQRSVFISHEVLWRSGVRVITPDRPGYGGSDFKPGRRIRDWPADIAEFVKHLRLQSFAALGFSGGTPYAIELAASGLPVDALGIVSGDAPPCTIPGLPAGLPATAAHRPWLTSLSLQLIRLLARVAPDITAGIGAKMLAPADRKVVSAPDIRRRFVNMLRDSLRQGPRGMLLDFQLADQDWEVQPPASRIPIHIWHGQADSDSPPSIARYLAQCLAGSRIHTFTGEAHVSVFVHHAEDILRTLSARAAGSLELNRVGDSEPESRKAC
jgi:pimeloyl-ACP methyl ester carboxylesterase